MRANRSFPEQPSISSAGATLVEVLMSLLILAIGVVPIFTLFPVSLLSSIKANQLTTTRLFADQVAATMISRPEMVMGAPGWNPNQTYSPGTIITSSIPVGNNSPKLRTYFGTATAGISGLKEPDPWLTGSPTTDNTISWVPRNLPTTLNTAAFIPYKYVIDPYGMMYADSALATDFGNMEGSTLNGYRVLRIHCGVTSELLAIRNKFTSPDTWSVAETVVPIQAVTIDTDSDSVAEFTDITFPNTVDISSYTDNGLTRVVAISPDGRRSEAGFVKGSPSASVLRVYTPLMSTTNSPENVTGAIGQVRIENFERRYTWLGAVQRDSSGGAALQIAICFNRSFLTSDEQLYRYRFLTAALDTLQVQWSGAEPYLVKGGYVFDAGSVSFRKIIDVRKNSLNSSAVVVLEKALTQSDGPFCVVCMPSIVQVYEMSL